MTAEMTHQPGMDWPVGDLYHSSWGLLPFQAEGIARTYLATEQGGGMLVVWDTGMGKSHYGMRMSTLLAEDARDEVRQHDLTVLVCEKGKVSEWAEDFAKFTRQEARVHHGTGRMQRLAKKGLPHVLITTYETAKADLVRSVKIPGHRGLSLAPGPLLEAIEGLSVLWVCDEMGKLRTRSSATYKAFEYTFNRMRKSHPTDHRVFGLTATPLETGWENAFNEIRLIRPDLMPNVGEFEGWFIKGRDPYGRPKYHADRMDQFITMCRPAILRKRKTDPDVIEQFPRRVEETRRLEMAPDQAEVYRMVESLQLGQEEAIPGLWGTLRQIAGHPAAIVRSGRSGGSVLASALLAELGEERLLGISSAKEKALLDYLDIVVNGQGAKAVIFTFFGQSILPILGGVLRQHGYKVFENHGGLTSAEMGRVRQEFRAHPDPCVFLTSDAGSRGINLPEASYVIEYESALTYANRTQRLDRIHRIDSLSPSVTCMTLVVDETIEVSILEGVLIRNKQSDRLLGDDDDGEDAFVTSADRKALLKMSEFSRRRIQH